MEEKLFLSDLAAIKTAVVDWMEYEELDPKTLVPDTGTAKCVLGYVCLLNNAWSTVELSDVNAGYPAMRQVSSSFLSLTFFALVHRYSTQPVQTP